MKMYYEKIITPIVVIHCYSSREKLIGMFFNKDFHARTQVAFCDSTIRSDSNEILKLLKKQLNEYFNGERKDFDIPINLTGSELQLAAWKQIQKIPFGKTLSYAEQARAIGRPKAVRAVASTNGQNRFPFLIPCHRVLRSDGSLGGYSGGVKLKEKLLAMERRTSLNGGKI